MDHLVVWSRRLVSTWPFVSHPWLEWFCIMTWEDLGLEFDLGLDQMKQTMFNTIYFFISKIYYDIKQAGWITYMKIWSCVFNPFKTIQIPNINIIPRVHWGASDIIVTSITTARRLSTTWQLTYKIAVPRNPWEKMGKEKKQKLVVWCWVRWDRCGLDIYIYIMYIIYMYIYIYIHRYIYTYTSRYA